MSGIEIGITSVLIIVLLIYSGLHVAIGLTLVSFLGVWFIRGNVDIAMELLVLSVADSISSYVFGVIPLFVLMGMLVAIGGLGRDTYDVASVIFQRLLGGLGHATVWANAVFAAVTGVSIASAAVFTRVAIPEMLRYGYRPRFAVGAVAGSSVLGMLLPPSLLLIVYGLLTEQSIGALFMAGILPGLLLSLAYSALIMLMAFATPNMVFDVKGVTAGKYAVSEDTMTGREMTIKMAPMVLLITVVIGGIYGGVFTPTEAGAVGALAAFVLCLMRRRLTMRKLWQVLVETGEITASICFLIIAASMYSRMLSIAGMPVALAEMATSVSDSPWLIIAVYVTIIILLGMIIDSVSIMLIVVPLFLPIFMVFQWDLIWIGIVTVIAVEIGLLTPPFGIACFVIHATLNDPRVTLNDIFIGAFPYAVTMFAVLLMVIFVPQIATLLAY